MSFDDFIAKWTGKPVDFDGVYPNQCMDLMHQYVYDVLGVTDRKVLSHPAAYQVFTDFTETNLFDKISNSPDGVPQKGDIVLFNKTSTNPYGHVCIFIEGTAAKFKSFDANWPVGSLPHVQEHTYGYCLGWLRFKNLPQSDDEKRALDYITLNRADGNLEGTVRAWHDSYLARPGLESKATTLEGFITKWIEEWKLPAGSNLVEIETEMAKLMLLEDRLQEFRDSIEGCVGMFPDDLHLLGAHKVVREQILAMSEEIASLQKKLEEAKVPSGYRFLKSWTILSLMWKLYKRAG